jgi:hypothetical protein
MNGNWYPWSEGTNGNRAGQFVRAWRHIHDIFTAAHATNVKWIWSPVARFGVQPSMKDYPGNAYVDMLGLSAFNGGTVLPWSGWRSFKSLVGSYLALFHRAAPSKPIQISEVGSAAQGGDRARWITAMFAEARSDPQVHSIVWFDLDKQTTWMLTTGSPAASAFAAGIRAADPLSHASATPLRWWPTGPAGSPLNPRVVGPITPLGPAPIELRSAKTRPTARRVR